jgi:peptide/nickel transport system permease protein
MPASTPASASAEPAVGRRRPWRRLRRSPTGIIGLVLTLVVLLVGVFAGTLAPSDPFTTVGPPLEGPSMSHLMGTDDLGRDMLSGVLYGMRTSAIVATIAVLLAGAIGVLVGAAAGYRGGRIDDVLMRITEIIQACPRFFLAVVAVALFGAGLKVVILVLGLTSWPMLARVVRAETLSLREREFVEAARALGSSDWRILTRHILPSVLPAAWVVISLLAASVILLEASLSYLGLGDPNVMSLGYLANNAQAFMRSAWWMAVFPGLAIVVAVLGLSLLSDAIGDAFNPFKASRRADEPAAAAEPALALER